MRQCVEHARIIQCHSLTRVCLRGRVCRYVTCESLKDARIFLPEELEPDGFKCDAFPSAALADRFVLVIMMVAVILPVSMFYSEFFKMAATRSAVAPPYLVVARVSTQQKLAGRGHGSIFQVRA